MAIVTLTLVESSSQVLSGIPEFVELSTSIPSTIFYTLDGTIPSVDSDIFISKLYLPTQAGIIYLKAYAVSGIDSSSLMEVSYQTVQTIDRNRLINNEGVSVLPSGAAAVDSLGVDSAGIPVRLTSIPTVDLDIRASRTTSKGGAIPNDTTLEFVQFPVPAPAVPVVPFYSSPDRVDFDPKAHVILVNGSTDADLDAQIVRIFNRAHGTIDVTSNFYLNRPREMDLVSGHSVRTMINPNTGKMVSYYFESRECRWLKSEQTITPKAVNIGSNTVTPNGFVFEWIDNRSLSALF